MPLPDSVRLKISGGGGIDLDHTGFVLATFLSESIEAHVGDYGQGCASACMSCCARDAGQPRFAFRWAVGADREAIKSLCGYLSRSRSQRPFAKRAVALGRRCAVRPPDRNSGEIGARKPILRAGELLGTR